MPSRRSKRGAGLRAAAREARKAAPGLEQDIEERKRYEDERDYWIGVGWEEWDNLDTETRQDLVRESLGVGLGAVGDAAMSPRKLGFSQAAKYALKQMAPNAARRLLAAKPRKSSKTLIEKLEKLRNSRVTKENELRSIRNELKKPGEPFKPAMSDKEALAYSARPMPNNWDSVGAMFAGASNPMSMGIVDARLRGSTPDGRRRTMKEFFGHTIENLVDPSANFMNMGENR